MVPPGVQCHGKSIIDSSDIFFMLNLFRLLPAEIFPLRARSKGMALATFSNWTFNFIIGMSSPDAFAGIRGYYYIIIAGFCLISVALAKFYYVETANHTLEEVAVAFGDKAFLHEDEQIVASAQLSRKVSIIPHA